MPTIQMTFEELSNAEPALVAIMRLRLPAKSAYHVAKLAKYVREELKLFTAQRTALITELGEERDATETEQAQGNQGKVHQVKPDNIPEFQKRISELGAVKATIAWGPITIEMLGDEKVPAMELMQLGELFTAE